MQKQVFVLFVIAALLIVGLVHHKIRHAPVVIASAPVSTNKEAQVEQIILSPPPNSSMEKADEHPVTTGKIAPQKHESAFIERGVHITSPPSPTPTNKTNVLLFRSNNGKTNWSDSRHITVIVGE